MPLCRATMAEHVPDDQASWQSRSTEPDEGFSCPRVTTDRKASLTARVMGIEASQRQHVPGTKMHSQSVLPRLHVIGQRAIESIHDSTAQGPKVHSRCVARVSEVKLRRHGACRSCSSSRELLHDARCPFACGSDALPCAGYLHNEQSCWGKPPTS